MPFLGWVRQFKMPGASRKARLVRRVETKEDTQLRTTSWAFCRDAVGSTGGDSASRAFWKPSGPPSCHPQCFCPGFLAREGRQGEREMGRAGLTLLKRG